MIIQKKNSKLEHWCHN